MSVMNGTGTVLGRNLPVNCETGKTGEAARRFLERFSRHRSRSFETALPGIAITESFGQQQMMLVSTAAPIQD